MAAFPVRAPHPDGAPPGHTGGFGEPTCAACHFDAPVDPGDGDVAVSVTRADSGAGDRRLRVRLRAEGLAHGGFQLSVRRASGPERGAQAGRLYASGDGVAVVDSGGVQYATHTEAGTGPARGDSLSWSVLWSPGGDVAPPDSLLVHVAANASNDDASPFGDRVYTACLLWRPSRPSSRSSGTATPCRARD